MLGLVVVSLIVARAAAGPRACATHGDHRWGVPCRTVDLGRPRPVSTVGWAGTGRPWAKC
jgi:hypothetical protein